MQEPYVVIDDFLSESEYRIVKEKVDNSDYRFQECISGTSTDNNPLLDCGWYKHWFRDNTDKEPFMTQIIGHNLSRYFNIQELLRIRLGLFTPIGTDEPMVHGPHIDYPFPHWTALLYTCTEEDAGHTYLWDHYHDPYVYPSDVGYVSTKPEELSLDKAVKVAPRDNRVIFFRGNMFHASSTPVSIVKRTAININFIGYPKNV